MNPTKVQGNPHYNHNNDYNKHKDTKEIAFTRIAFIELALQVKRGTKSPHPANSKEETTRKKKANKCT